MPRLPMLSGQEAAKVFGRAGWIVARQRGSHMILLKPSHQATLSIPDHKVVAKGTLRSLIRAAGMTVEEFVSLADR